MRTSSGLLPITRCPTLARVATTRCAKSSFLGWQLPARSFGASRAATVRSRVAVLYQALEPPIINGTTKPMKAGGYRDSSADIAYNLSRSKLDMEVLSQASTPDPAKEIDWCFPDTEDGILSAIDKGATHLWANTILFASHPLQTSSRIGRYESGVRVIGQAPLLVDKYDDKNYVNSLLQRDGRFPMPRCWTIRSGQKEAIEYSRLPYPVVAKPARGRGSHGVKVCYDQAQLKAHLDSLAREGLNSIIVEEFLAGEEATVTVMPPGEDGRGYWSLPVVTRFNHQDNIAPYNGKVAVTSNSRAVLDPSVDAAYAQVAAECELAAQMLGVTSPIRIDVRRFRKNSAFALFDVNMKPNMTGPGRPGRDEQASLTLIAAEALGWNYTQLLEHILRTSSTPLSALRQMKPRL